ncbi:EH signature domain-containing protein [Shewanella oncorhynchi]|uniref:EH signature domain-containing protein n=1 Tax=Shewanella oncorhynchi TaxID=2726434 RepID=UPI003D7B3FCD
MKLPEAKFMLTNWSFPTVNAWAALQTKASKIEGTTGQNSAFEQMLTKLRNMAMSGHCDELPELLKFRLTARALSWFWLSDDQYAARLLSPQRLSALLNAQKPRLTRITLQQLVQLYFRRFDLLDQHDRFRDLLEQALLSQLEHLPEPRIATLRPNPLIILKQEGRRLLALNGPRQLAEQTLQAECELGETFKDLGLQGLDYGRYGDICRAHFYLVTLRNLSLDEWSPVMDELLKPLVSKAPFEGDRCIGHAALEILIDRAGQEPSDVWQTFILNLAGDPRIASSAANYRQWWQPLGEARIQKVRGWLSREDLRLFLQAVEQYGIQSHNYDLQRMFPARKLFLEGLFKLKLIRNSRLLLGHKAQQIVKEILGKEVRTSFAPMDGAMSDKAVIYLDCGDFYLIEGSHSFKIWVYLAQPSDTLTSYDKRIFSHHSLTGSIPENYRKLYSKLPSASFVHSPHIWQHKVFSFLAENGISLDMEQLLSSQDYQHQLRRFGIPVVNPNKTQVPTPRQQTTTSQETRGTTRPTQISLRHPNTDIATESALFKASSDDALLQSPANAIQTLNNRLPKPSSKLNDTFGHTNKKATSAIPERSSLASAAESPSLSLSKKCKNISRLTRKELKILRYFAQKNGDSFSSAAEALNLKLEDVHKALLNGIMVNLYALNTVKDVWHLTAVAFEELAAYETYQLQSTAMPVDNPKTTQMPASSQPTTKPLEASLAKQPAQASLRPTPVGEDTIPDTVKAQADSATSQPAVDSIRGASKLSPDLVSRLNNKFKCSDTPVSEKPNSPRGTMTRANAVEMPSASLSDKCPQLSKLKLIEIKTIKYLATNGGAKASQVAEALGMTVQDANKLFSEPLNKLCQEDAQAGWHLTSTATEELAAYLGHQRSIPVTSVASTQSFPIDIQDKSYGVPTSAIKVVDNQVSVAERSTQTPSVKEVEAPPTSLLEKCPKVSRLKPMGLKVLRYFAANPSDKARHAANVLGLTVQEVNKLLYGPLAKLCSQDAQYGWQLTSMGTEELAAFEKHQ